MTAEDDSDDVAHWLSIPAGEKWCRKACTLALRKTGGGNGRHACRKGCWAWDCPSCGPKKRAWFGRHIAGKFLLSETTVGEHFCPLGKWDSARKRIQRAGGEYATVERFGGGWWVFHTAGGVLCGEVLPDPADAVRRLGQRLRELVPVRVGGIARPVSSSHPWKWPEREGGELEFESLLPVANPDRLADDLKAEGVSVRRFGEDGGREWGMSYALDHGERLERIDGTFRVVKDD